MEPFNCKNAGLETWSLKKTRTHVFFWEYCEIFESIFFYRTPPVAASVTANLFLRMTENEKRLLFKCFVFLDWRGLDVWLVQLNFPAGGPYKITATSIVGNQLVSISLEDVYFGDVWLCGGQSNMVFTTNMVWIFLGHLCKRSLKRRYLRFEEITVQIAAWMISCYKYINYPDTSLSGCF